MFIQKTVRQPIKKKYLLTGELEPTNDAYALQKLLELKCVKVTITIQN